MNPLQAGVLLLFAVAVTFSPWRRGEPAAPGRALLLEAALLVAALIAGTLLAALVHPTPTGLLWGRRALYVAAYWYAVAGGIGIVRLVLALVPVGEGGPPEQAGIAVPRGELSRGRIIGVLERGLALTLVLLSEFGALGFIVAAKAIARFRGLDNRDFAEYFVIGTLASLLHAVLVGVGLRLLLS